MERRTAARAVVCLLLAGSGGVAIAADAQRWWPCRPYDFDAPACARRQSDFFDYVAPNASWIPIGTAAQVAGIGMLLLAAAVLVLPRVLSPEAPRWLARALGVLMSCGVAVVGAVTWLGGQAGRPVAEALVRPAFAVWILGWLLALLVLFVLVVIDSGRLRWRLALLTLLGCLVPSITLLLDALLFAYWSYDANPWTDAVGGACSILAAGALWLGTSPDRMRGMEPASRRRDLVPEPEGGLA